MSDDLLTAIATKIDAVDSRVGTVETRMGAVEIRMGAVETRLVAVETRMGGVETRMGAVETRVGGVETRLGGVETKIDSLRTDMYEMGDKLRGDLTLEMRILHEDVIDKIKALAPDFAPIRREFRAADADLREEFDRRLSPVEAALRGRTGHDPA